MNFYVYKLESATCVRFNLEERDRLKGILEKSCWMLMTPAFPFSRASKNGFVEMESTCWVSQYVTRRAAGFPMASQVVNAETTNNFNCIKFGQTN